MSQMLMVHKMVGGGGPMINSKDEGIVIKRKVRGTSHELESGYGWGKEEEEEKKNHPYEVDETAGHACGVDSGR